MIYLEAICRIVGMRINLAKSAGFCFGVKRALTIGFNATASAKTKVYMLGDIVHNEDVVKRIKKAGIKKIQTLQKNGKNKILLLPAHGTGLKMLRQAKRLGYKIVDATCPMVKQIHRIARQMQQEGHAIIIIGDKKHTEVEGIAGQLKNKAVIINGIKNIPLKKIKKIKKAAVVVQSTQELEKVLKIVGVLKNYIKGLKFFNTICKPTQFKQKDIKIMPLKNEVMLVIGSKNSANTKRLYEISKALNRRSFWINSRKEIKRCWFRNVNKVGITAGASTPESTIQDIIKHILKFY